jgi:hypothetical protein
MTESRVLFLTTLLAGCASGPRICETYRLPFPATEARLVIQGNNGVFSHTGRYRYAWDFQMPEGSDVTAAEAGVVAEVIDRYTEGRPDHALEDRANVVVIDHGRARFSVYQHLKLGGALVTEGQPVERGQLIGHSGNTGFTTGPHLHFAVIDHRNRSQAVCFADVEGGVPVQGQRVAPRPLPPPPSWLPRDAFADNGIALTSDVPARRITGAFTVEGVTTRAAKRAVAWFLPRERDGRIRSFFGAIGGDGRFTIRVEPTGLGDLSGSLDFAIGLEGPDGRYSSAFTVPVVVRAPLVGGGSARRPTAPSR